MYCYITVHTVCRILYMVPPLWPCRRKRPKYPEISGGRLAPGKKCKTGTLVPFCPLAALLLFDATRKRAACNPPFGARSRLRKGSFASESTKRYPQTASFVPVGTNEDLHVG